MSVEASVACHLRDLEERLLQAHDLASLLDEEFVEFGQSGRIYDRQMVLAALAPGTKRRSGAISDFATRLMSPGVVLATYRLTEPKGASLRASIWRLRGDAWTIAFHQGTALQAG